jgi:hypothetical protein
VQQLEKDKDADGIQTPLRYPGNVEIDAAGSRLFISDSSNHRILVTSWDGEFQVRRHRHVDIEHVSRGH